MSEHQPSNDQPASQGRKRRTPPRTVPVQDQRSAFLTLRVTPDQKAEFMARAQRAGYSTGAYLRALMSDGKPGPRAHRRRPVEHQILVQVLASQNRIGSNLNQIARKLNMDLDINAADLRDALARYKRVVAALYEALGMEPSGDNQGQEPGRS